MSRLRRLGAVSFCAGLLAVTAQAQERRANGFIVIEVEPPTSAPKLLDMTLTIAAFTPEDQTFHTTGLGKGWAVIKIDRRAQEPRTYTVAAAPGTYAVQRFNISHWAACFNGGTQVVTVDPGETVHIGRFDPNGPIEAIQAEVDAGRLPRSSGGADSPTLFDLKLALEPGDEPQADLQPATFDTGEIGWMSKQRTCGVTEIMRRRAKK